MSEFWLPMCPRPNSTPPAGWWRRLPAGAPGPESVAVKHHSSPAAPKNKSAAVSDGGSGGIGGRGLEPGPIEGQHRGQHCRGGSRAIARDRSAESAAEPGAQPNPKSAMRARSKIRTGIAFASMPGGEGEEHRPAHRPFHGKHRRRPELRDPRGDEQSHAQRRPRSRRAADPRAARQSWLFELTPVRGPAGRLRRFRPARLMRRSADKYPGAPAGKARFRISSTSGSHRPL